MYMYRRKEGITTESLRRVIERSSSEAMADASSNTCYIPEGYRFKPSDEELVYCFLIPRVTRRALPANIIYEVELKNYNPESLAERYEPQGENTWYFFTQRDRKYRNGERPDRTAGDGYWKASGSELVKRNGIKMGYKKTLVFHRGKHPKGKKTNWIMYEYTVYKSSKQSKQRASQDHVRLDEYVLCTIHEHRRYSKSTDDDDENNGDEENFKITQSLDQNAMDSNIYNSPLEHNNIIQNNHMISYQPPIQNVIDPSTYNAHVEQGNHTQLTQLSKQNIMNSSVEEDISEEELYEILFGAPKHNAMNPNIEESIPIQEYYTTSHSLNQNVSNPKALDNLDESIPMQDHYTTSSYLLNQNVFNPNTFDNPDESILIQDHYIASSQPLNQNNTNPNTFDDIDKSISIQGHCTMSSQPLSQNADNPNTFGNSSFVGGYGDFPVEQVNPFEQPYMSHPQDPLLLHCQRIFSSPSDQFSNVENNLSTNPNAFDNLSLVGGCGDFPIDQEHPCGQPYINHPQDPLLLLCQRIFPSPFEQISITERSLPTNSNAFGNPGLIGGYDNFPVDQVQLHGQPYMNHP